MASVGSASGVGTASAVGVAMSPPTEDRTAIVMAENRTVISPQNSAIDEAGYQKILATHGLTS